MPPALKRVQILPVSPGVVAALNGRNRLAFLAGELRRRADNNDVLTVGDVIEAEGLEFVVCLAEPHEGRITKDTEFFVDGEAAPVPLAFPRGPSSSSSSAAPVPSVAPPAEVAVDMELPHGGLRRARLLPIGEDSGQKLGGRSRMEFLAPELQRLSRCGRVLRAGEVLHVEGVEYIFVKTEPLEGTLSSATEFFLYGGAVPRLEKIHFVGLDGPRDTGDQHLVDEYVKPYFAGRLKPGSQQRRLIQQGDVITCSVGVRLAVCATEPHAFGIAHSDTTIFANWDTTAEFDRIHFVPFGHTVPRGAEPDVFVRFLKPYLEADTSQRFAAGDVITCSGVRFEVAACEPEGEGPRRVGQATEIFSEGTLPFELHLSRRELNLMPPEQLHTRWVTGRVRAARREYQRAVDQICVADELMTSSNLGRRMEFLEEQLRAGPAPSMVASALRATRKAFGLSSDAEARVYRGGVSGLATGNMFQGAILLYEGLTWERPYLAEALSLLCDGEDAFSLQVTLALLRRGADECHARKVYAFNAVLGRLPVTAASLGGWPLPRPGGASALEVARAAVLAVVTELVEETKEAAFSTVFLEPTKMYFQAVHSSGFNDVDVHGANVYLAILMATLGVELSRRPFLYDDTNAGVADFLGAGMHESLSILWREEHFGRAWESIGELRRRRPKARNFVPQHFIFDECVSLLGLCRACGVANAAIDPEGSEAKRGRLAAYLEHFAFWFSRGFMLPRMVNRLLGDEGRPEALQLLLDDLLRLEAQGRPAPASASGEEEDVRFWLWDMESFPAELREDRAERLLQHAGALRR